MDPITLDPPVKFPPVPAPRVVTPPATPPKPAEVPAPPPPAAAAAPKPAGSRKLLVGIAAAASLAGGVAGVRYFGPSGDPGSAADTGRQGLVGDEKATPPAAAGGSEQKAEQRTNDGGGTRSTWPPEWEVPPAAAFGLLYPAARVASPFRPVFAFAPAAPDLGLGAGPGVAAVPPASLAGVVLPTAPPDIGSGLGAGPSRGAASAAPVAPPDLGVGLGAGPSNGYRPTPPSTPAPDLRLGVGPQMPPGLGAGPQPDPYVRPAAALDVPKPNEPAKKPTDPPAAGPAGLPALPDLPNAPGGSVPPPAGGAIPAALPQVPTGGPMAPAALPPTPVPAAPAALPTALPDRPASVPAATLPGAAPALPVGLNGQPGPQPAAVAPSVTPDLTRPAAAEHPPAPVAETQPRRLPTVDVYDPRPGDRYESVSREFYGDPGYAAALQAYNGGRPLQPGRPVDVPPVHVLKKKFGPPAAGAARPTPTAEWQSTAGDPTFRPGRPRTFTVPAGGMSMRAVAREALGDPQRWVEVYDLNRAYDPGSVPAGAQLQLPTGGRPPE